MPARRWLVVAAVLFTTIGAAHAGPPQTVGLFLNAPGSDPAG